MVYVFLNIHSMLAPNQCTKNSLIQVTFILNSIPTNNFLFLLLFLSFHIESPFIELKFMFINSLQTELKITYSKNLIQLNPSDSDLFRLLYPIRTHGLCSWHVQFWAWCFYWFYVISYMYVSSPTRRQLWVRSAYTFYLYIPYPRAHLWTMHGWCRCPEHASREKE